MASHRATKGDKAMNPSSYLPRKARTWAGITGLFLVASVLALGCQRPTQHVQVTSSSAAMPQTAGTVSDELQAALARLSPEDRQLALAQKYCPVMEDSRLGEMGPPIKLEIKGQAVFICCKGCRSKALREADITLAKVAQFKARGQSSAKP
jgi:hypothetical protein